MNNQKKSFLDSNTLLAMALTFIIFIGWQKYMESRYPQTDPQKNAQESLMSDETNQSSPSPNESDEISKPQNQLSPNVPIEEKILSYKNEMWSFDINSKGMAVENVVIKNINRVENKPYNFIGSEAYYESAINDQVLNFNIQKVGENKFSGTAYHNGVPIKKNINIDDTKFTLSVSIEIPKEIEGNLQQKVSSQVQPPKNKIFFLPAFERNEFFITGREDEERLILNPETNLESPVEYKTVKVASIGDEYFTAALIDHSAVLPSVKYNQNKDLFVFEVEHAMSALVKSRIVKFDLFFGPKNVSLLNSVSPELGNIINFMYLGIIARPILRALNYIYSLVGNYGWAVVILTILIRLLIMPLMVTSMKSMKKMQSVQPEIKKLKEKYKDQPNMINQKTMELYKKHGINPLGGCLPLLIQMPIFFAFYRALSESVDLYQAPFIGWISDLSTMDPYFIFPILSMLGMTVHQLVTPNTMEKLQRRMMLIMPIVFGLFFITLPSALTIYMAVSSWFGVLQHQLFLKDQKS